MEILSDSIFGLILHHICSSGNWGCWYFPELKVTQVKVDWRPLNYVLGSCRYRTSLGGLRQCSVASKYNLFPLVFAWQWEKSDWCLSVRPVYFVVGSSGFRTSHRGRNGWFQSPTRSLLSRHRTKLDPFHDLRPLQQAPEYGKFPRYASDRMATEATLWWNRSNLRPLYYILFSSAKMCIGLEDDDIVLLNESLVVGPLTSEDKDSSGCQGVHVTCNHTSMKLLACFLQWSGTKGTWLIYQLRPGHSCSLPYAVKEMVKRFINMSNNTMRHLTLSSDISRVRLNNSSIIPWGIQAWPCYSKCWENLKTLSKAHLFTR